VDANVDILTCEIEGIVLCLELVNRYFNEGGKSGNSESVFILNDCTVEIGVAVISGSADWRIWSVIGCAPHVTDPRIT